MTLASTLRCDPWSRLCRSAFLHAAGHAHPISPASYDITKRGCLLHGRFRDGARVIRYACLRMLDASGPFGKQNKPLALASRPKSIGPDRRRTLAYGSAYAPTTGTVKLQLAAPAVSSSSVGEVQPASCCCCRCRPTGVTAETTAVDRNHSSTPASTAILSIGRGDVVRTVRVSLLYPCRFAREKLSVRE